MKTCSVKGCNIEIPAWNSYCDMHWKQINAQQLAMGTGQDVIRQQPQLPPLPPPPLPPQQQPQPPQQQFQQQQPTIPQQLPQRQQPFKIPEPPEIPKFDEPEEEEFEEEQEPPQIQKRQYKPKSMKKKEMYQIPQIDENTRIEIKKACMQSAVSLIAVSEDLMTTDLDELIKNIEILTSVLYKITVGRNEFLDLEQK